MNIPTVKTKIQVRFSDTDAMGHVASSSYLHYMEVGRSELFNEISKKSESPYFAVVNTTIDYLSEIIFGQNVSIVTVCSQIGKKSLTLSSDIYAGDKLSAKGRVTLVGFDPESRKSVCLPAHWEISEEESSLS